MLRTSARSSQLRYSASALSLSARTASRLPSSCTYYSSASRPSSVPFLGNDYRSNRGVPCAASSSSSSHGLPLFWRQHYDSLIATRVREFSAAAAAPPPPAASAPPPASSSSEATAAVQQQHHSNSSDEPVVVEDGIISAGEEKAVEKPKTDRWSRIKEKVKKELHHYWTGSKLLAMETRISSKLFWRLVVHNETLTRRERRQLTRTAADLLRLIPFAVIVIIPFLEFALPVLIKLFPNMLPSTFDDAERKEAIRKAKLRVKIEMAQFLHETTLLMAQQLMQKKAAAMAATGATDEDHMSVDEFNLIMYKVKQGIHVTNDEIVKYARFFQDELTLDQLSRQQLVAMCKFLNVATWGTTAILRRSIKNKVKQLRDDDRLIAAEGLETLTDAELRNACIARGINPERSVDQLRRKLAEWLDLSLNKDIPISVLILSRAFSSSMRLSDDAIKETLSHLPVALVDEAKEQIADMEPETAEKRLQKLKDEERAIREEQEEAKKAEKGLAPADAAAAAAKKKPTPVVSPAVAGAKAAVAEAEKEQEDEDIQEMLEELKEVKEDIEETKEVLEELKEDLEELEREREKQEKQKKDKKKKRKQQEEEDEEPTVTEPEEAAAEASAAEVEAQEAAKKEKEAPAAEKAEKEVAAEEEEKAEVEAKEEVVEEEEEEEEREAEEEEEHDVEPEDAETLDKLTKKVGDMVAEIEKELSSEAAAAAAAAAAQKGQQHPPASSSDAASKKNTV